MDSDDSSNSNDPIASYHGHPGIFTGQSSSSQAVDSDPNIHLHCVNCGINISRMRRHPLVMAEVRYLIQRWIEPQQVNIHMYIRF